MATAMATAAVPHQVPPFVLNPGPRIRPPRMLPGQPHPNSNPQPDGPRPGRKVWVQGKWRQPESNAVKHHRSRLSQRVEKALAHHEHGMNIYAYTHVRTNQVVYSLTRLLEESKILPQLIYHGKKTVPSSIRKDMWAPYFSIQFPKTPAGAQAGLLAYQQLRELSLQRQLSPPEELVKTSQADIDRILSMYDPVDLDEKKRTETLKIPHLGQNLPKFLRARRLMDQKATSVADAAFVLSLQAEMLSPEERYKRLLERPAKKVVGRSKKYQRRMQILAEIAQKKEMARLEVAKAALGRQDGMEVAPDASARLRLEHQTDLNSLAGRTTKDLKMIEKAGAIPEPVKKDDSIRSEDSSVQLEKAKGDSVAGEERVDPSRVVEILWADKTDGRYANQWPGNVFHGEMERKAGTELALRSGPLFAAGSVFAAGAQAPGPYTAHRQRASEAKEDFAREKRQIVINEFYSQLVYIKIRLDMALLTSIAGEEDRLEEFLQAAREAEGDLDGLLAQINDADPEQHSQYKGLRRAVDGLIERVRHEDTLERQYSDAKNLGFLGEDGKLAMPFHQYLALKMAVADARGERLPRHLRFAVQAIGVEAEPLDQATSDVEGEIESADVLSKDADVNEEAAVAAHRGGARDETIDAQAPDEVMGGEHAEKAEQRLAEFLGKWPAFERYEESAREEPRQAQRHWRNLVLRLRSEEGEGSGVDGEGLEETPEATGTGLFARLRKALLRRLPFGPRI